MRKILFLLCTLLATAGAWADPISDVSQLLNSKAYTITTARGALTLNQAGTAIVSSLKTNGTVNNDEADTSAEAQEFAICKMGDYFYIYNLKAEKFLTLNNGNTQLSDYVTTPFYFHSSGDNNYPLNAAIWNDERYVNNNNGGGIVINTWKYQDAGNQLAIAEARDLNSTEKTAISTAVNGSPLNSNKAFTVTAERGTWCANASGTSLATTVTNTNPETGFNQFALMIFEGNMYIYNVGSQKYIKKNGNLAEGRGDPIAIRLSGDNDYPYMFYFPNGPIYFNMQNGGGSYAMDSYATPDPGNKQKINQVEVDATAEALAQYNRTVSVTYNVMYEGEKVGTETVTQRLGTEPNATSNTRHGFDCNYSPNLIQSETTTVTANIVLPFTVSPDYVGATWYNMYIRQNDCWVGYNKGADDSTPEPYKPYAATDADKESKALQWAFVGNPFTTTGIKVINREAGRGMSLKKVGAMQ